MTESARTTEDKVRRIAEEVMGLEAKVWVSEGGGWLLCPGYQTHSSNGAFRPHFEEGSGDRERVMRKMDTCHFNFKGGEGDLVTITDTPAFGERPVSSLGGGPDPGLAFIDAVDAWLDARADCG